jgi:hypothetical protein
MIDDYKELLIGYVENDSSLKSMLETVLSTEDPPPKGWRSVYMGK